MTCEPKLNANDWTDAESCEPRTFRDVLGSFLTGITIVATRDESGSVRAFTANSFTSVSLDPPLVLVCLAKSSGSLSTFTQSQTFSVNILGDWQRDAASTFARRGPEKDAALNALGTDNPPVIENSLTTLSCALDRAIDAGDHTILMGKVLRFKSRQGQPLGYFKGGFVAFGLAAQTLEQINGPVLIGGLLFDNGRVVLCRRPGASQFEIPTTPLLSGAHHGGVVKDLFARLGINAQPSFPYSVFQEQGQPYSTIVFTVEATEPPTYGIRPDGTEVAAFGVADQPWKLVAGPMTQGMIERVFQEHAAGNFGLYYDTPDGGRVAPIGKNPLRWSDWPSSKPARAPSDVHS